ncbi:MAG: hypothetical protein LUQ64_05760 [Methanomicrobiales archaeon]|nr:hypothetical protein [Methanomicrobiales archaeon]
MRRARLHHLGKPPRMSRPPQGSETDPAPRFPEYAGPDLAGPSWDQLIRFHVAWIRQEGR